MHGESYPFKIRQQNSLIGVDVRKEGELSRSRVIVRSLVRVKSQ